MDKLLGLFLIVLAIFVAMMTKTGDFRFIICAASGITGVWLLLPSGKK